MGYGDEIMAAGQARQVHLRDPGRRRVRILDRAKQVRLHELWAGLPYIAQPGQSGDLLYVLNAPGVRPYIAEKHPERWVWKEWPEGSAPIGELRLALAHKQLGERFAGRVILEPSVKAKASPNKEWGWMRWNKLAWLLQERYALKVTQVGPVGTQLLDGGIEHIITPTFREACAVLSRARAAVLPEGGLHHAAAAFNVPAVVIFGGYIAPRVTGYESQVNLFRGEGLGCGMRRTCDHCRDAMAKISPEHVAERLMELMRVPASANLAA